MPAASMTNGLATHSVLLVGERKRDKGGCEELSGCTMERVETALIDPDANILHAKKIVGGGPGTSTILTGAK